MLLGQPLPNFFIAGAPKAGTTSLYHYLDQHPEIYMSPIKEPCYFSSELRPEHYSEELQPWINREKHALKEYLDGPILEKRFGGLVSEWEDYVKLFRNAQGAEPSEKQAFVTSGRRPQPETSSPRSPAARLS